MSSQPIAPLWNSLALDRSAAASLQDQIAAYFRQAVLEGRVKGGARVPSSRDLAAEQNVARITVVEAYDRLVAEGYLTARRGAGLFVAESVPEDYLRPASAKVGTPGARRRSAGLPRIGPKDWAPSVPDRPHEILPLSVGIPALDQFPWAEWTRLNTRFYRSCPRGALGYSDPRGIVELRTAIAEYLGTARGIACEPDQVLVVSGSQQGIDLTARALAAPGDRVWIEEPGYQMARVAFQAAALETVPVCVDAEGIDVAAGVRAAPRARIAFVSPSYQHPLGMTMSLRRRLALLDWAESADAWLLEDDYAGEFRYTGRPLPPLHTLDRGNRVLYLGTFGKVLAPGLRLGYIVVPLDLVDRFTALKTISDRQAPGLVQHVLAQFITEGRLAVHLRRMRLLYARRRSTLLDLLARDAAGVLDASGATQAGLHFVARLCIQGDDLAISRRALEQGVYAAALSSYYSGAVRERGFLLGFASTPEEQMEPAVRRLVGAVKAGRR